MLIKVFLSLFALIPLLVPGTFNDGGQLAGDVPGKTTTTGVGFGKPNDDCSGFGICVVSADFETGLRDNFGVGKITMDSRGSVSSILFLNESLTKNTVQRHFSGSHFLMEEPYVGKLKMGEKYLEIRIPAGKYRINKSKSGFLLEVTG